MKNLKNYLIAGMVGLGSFGIFGNNGYGQDTLPQKRNERYVYKKTLGVYDYNHDEKVDKFVLYFLDPKFRILEYSDEDFDGEMESYDVIAYSSYSGKIIKSTTGKFKIEDSALNEIHKKIVNKLKKYNYPIDVYSFCEEINCNKENIFECLLELF